MSQSFKYRIVVAWSEEDEAFVARVPTLAPCAAHGDTPDEAVRQVVVAAAAVLEVMAEDGQEIPPMDITPDPATVPLAAAGG